MVDPDSREGDSRSTDAAFATAIGSLTDGALLFPPPFDLASSAALARNATDGSDAVTQFPLNRTGTQYRILIVEEPVDGTTGIEPRDIINCTVQDRHAAAALLGTLAEELMLDEDESPDN